VVKISHLEKINHIDRIAVLKFSYVTSCQIYADQLAVVDSRAADIDLFLPKYSNWHVSYVDTVHPPTAAQILDYMEIDEYLRQLQATTLKYAFEATCPRSTKCTRTASSTVARLLRTAVA